MNKLKVFIMLKFIKNITRGVFAALSLSLLICSVFAAEGKKGLDDTEIIVNGEQIEFKNINGYMGDMSLRFDLENEVLNIIRTEPGELPHEKNIPMRISDDGRIYLLEKCELYDRTTDEIWEKMGMNVFGFLSGGFIYKNGECIDLPGVYYYGGLGAVCVADLNNDGDYQLLYISRFGSGIDGHNLNCYSEKYKITSTVGGAGGFYLSKIDDQNVYIRYPYRLNDDIYKLRLEKSVGYSLVADKVDEEKLPQLRLTVQLKEQSQIQF